MDKICEILIIYIQFGGSEVSLDSHTWLHALWFHFNTFFFVFWYAVLIFP